MEVMMEVDGAINTNNDIQPMEVDNVVVNNVQPIEVENYVINNNNEIQPMEVENDEAANELSIAIQNQNPFHYAKLYLHKEVTNRDAKINELLAQIDNCHQQINDMQRKDRLFYMQKELNQQKDAHHKRRNACKESTISEFNWPMYPEKPTIPTVGSHTETKRAISRRSCFKKSTM